VLEGRETNLEARAQPLRPRNPGRTVRFLAYARRETSTSRRALGSPTAPKTGEDSAFRDGHAEALDNQIGAERKEDIALAALEAKTCVVVGFEKGLVVLEGFDASPLVLARDGRTNATPRCARGAVQAGSRTERCSWGKTWKNVLFVIGATPKMACKTWFQASRRQSSPESVRIRPNSADSRDPAPVAPVRECWGSCRWAACCYRPH